MKNELLTENETTGEQQHEKINKQSKVDEFLLSCKPTLKFILHSVLLLWFFIFRLYSHVFVVFFLLEWFLSVVFLIPLAWMLNRFESKYQIVRLVRCFYFFCVWRS